ncbi:MAG TPA: glycine cleavage system aminomethyltransferase GcvT [Elusimicrobiota bacterium]|nr:glycine cleavage system aminomethyltransferase GcvT [Elusimicrobiota bacterium]
MSVSSAPRRTPLHALHSKAGAKLVDFHGWELPLQFSGIIKEHQAVRAACGIFDVSHMGQAAIEGPQALELLGRIFSNDAARLAPGQAHYTHMLNEKGGVIDDVILSRLAPERFFVVLNASNAEGDLAWIGSHARGMNLRIVDRREGFGMVAVQGPAAAKTLACLLPGCGDLARFGAREERLYGHDVLLTRTGYTGEDGFEVAAPEPILSRLWENLEAAGASYGLLPCGLGARDTLRLEAGLLLHGSDVDPEHTPLEAGYPWVVRLGARDFVGKAALERQKKEGVSRRLLGVKLAERGVPRPGGGVRAGGRLLGTLTSATFSPTLQTGIGMAYLPPDVEPGAALEVDVHGRAAAAQACALPFYRRKPT